MEGTDHMEHLFFKGIHICLLGAVEFVAVKNTFSAAAGRTYITAGITADTFAQLALEECKFFFRAHCFDSLLLLQNGLHLCLLGLADEFSS
jgi:hypothetical protein